MGDKFESRHTLHLFPIKRENAPQQKSCGGGNGTVPGLASVMIGGQGCKIVRAKGDVKPLNRQCPAKKSGTALASSTVNPMARRLGFT